MSNDILSLSVQDFVAATAAKAPTPGGGSVAALAGALGAALAQMSVNYSVGKKSLEAQRSALESARARLGRASEMLLELVREDIAAYEALSGFLKLPTEQRLGEPEFLPTVVAAIRVPESIGAIATNIMDLCEELFDKTNPLLHSDLVLAGALADAAARGAELNVLANLSLLPDPQEALQTRERAGALVAKADAGWTRLRARLNARL